jgi:hypothetical protein
VLTPSLLTTMLGLPAGVVPVTRVRPGEESDRPDSKDRSIEAARTAEQGSAGLPVGVQVVGRHWREDLVLAAMRRSRPRSSHPDHPGLRRCDPGRGRHTCSWARPRRTDRATNETGGATMTDDHVPGSPAGG